MYLLTVLVIFFGNMNLLPFVDSKPEVDPGDKPLPPRIQIRAILIRCPQHIIPDISKSSRGTSNDDKVISVLRTDDIMRFSGFDKDELLMHSEVKNCKRKMIITMMINNLGRTVTEEEFVVVDHVYDPDLHKRSRLLNPFVFKIKQDPVLQLYGMRYVQSVNAMAKEEVLNKGLNNFTGCDTTSSHPTCGMVYHNNRIVPYSEGFCCSCDSYVNLQRQPGLSIVRQQKIFSDRKGKCFVENKDLNDGDKYYTEKFKRDVNEQNDNFLKRSGNLDVLRSKYMSSDFDFAKNGFYTPQIVRRRNHFGDDFNKLENSEEVSTWERKSRLNNAVFEKGNRILWNNDNLEQIPNADEEEKRDEPVEKKKRSVDGERTESLNSNGIEIVDNGLDKKFQEVDIDNEESLNTVEKKIIDRSDERAERQDARGKANQSVDDVEKIFEDKIEKLQDGEGETNLSLNEIVERDHETKKERSVRDETGNFLQSGMRVTGEKPFLLRPKDWSSLKALKLRVKGLKPVSPLYQCGYQPSHRYVKVQEENRPAMEHAKGFQMSDYRPRWNSNSRIPFKKPGPWDIIPPICSSDKRTKNILRVLTKLNEKLCLTDTVDESVDESKLLDSLMKNIDKSLVRTRRNNVSEIEQPHTNNSQLSDDSSKHEKCEEAWNELQTLLLEQTIDEKRSLQDSSMNKNMIVPDITYNEKDNKMIERLKRQIDRWFDENYEINSLNISNSSIGYGDTAHITNNNDDSFLSNADQNSTLPFGLNRDSLINFNEGDGLENYYNSFFDGPRRYLELKDFDFLNGNRENATNLYEFSERNRKYLGLLPHSQFEKLKPVSNNGFNNITVSNWDEQSKIHDKFLNENRKNLNIALEHPELPQEENNYRRNNLAAFNMNNNDNKIDNVAEGVGDLQKFVLNPPPHFHSKSGPVFIDENRYGPLLDTHPVKLSKTSPNSNSLVSNNSNFIHPFDFSRKIIEVEDNPNSQIKSNSIMIGNNLQEKQILIAAPSELNGENSDKLVRYSDENIQRMNEYPAEQVGSSHDMSGVWNSIEKGSSGPSPQKVIDERNSFFMRSEPESNMRKLDVSRNSDLQNNFNQNADFGTKLGFDSRSFVLDNDRNVNKIVNRNTDNASTNNEIMFDEMPISSNSSFNGSNPSKGNNLSHKSYHIYKQEMESPYVIHTSHAKHKSNFQILKSNGEDSNNERSHFLEVATEFGNPSLLNASDVQHLMQKAMISGSGNLSQSSFHNSSQSPTVPKSSPVLISGNVGNLYGQKGKLIFIPDDPEEQIPPNKQLDIENYQRKYLENVEYGNSKMNLFGESNHVSYPNFTNSETCIAGRPGYGISNFGKNYVNPKYSSYFKNWAGNPDRDSWGTSLPIEELSDSFFNSDNAQLNFINRNIDAKYDINPISSSNRINDGLSAQFKSENRVNIDAPSENSKPALNKFDFKDDKTSILENDVIEKRDTEKSGSRSKKNTKKVRRQVSSNGNQIRGGQNCIDRYVPPGANPITYHESAHCLRFSDLWYSVYTIKKPNLDHSLQLHLYEKNNFPQATHWEELTRGITTDLGTGNRHIEDGYSTLSFTYIPLTDLMRGDFCLDEHRATLLVPESLPPALAAKYPQLSGSANEYLLVQSDDISLEGDECNKVGTSFEGFATQPDRCTQPRGTCLQNQPIDMWTHDIMARDEGRPGKFFLENYAVVAEQPLLVNQSSQEQSLALEYYRQFSTIIEVEVKSDLNAIVRTGESGQLSEVFVDSSCHSNTKLTVIVTNQGLASSAYYPKLSNCPVELPEVWTHNVGPLVMIAPQHRHIFQMTMYGELAVDRFHCSVELMNDKKELVATRRVRIQKHDRCICVWHCLCACTASTEGLSCEPMSMPHYHAAGFQGSLPVVHLHPETGSEKILKIILPILIVVWFSLLIGLIKAIFGLCCTIVGAYGLWAVCKGRSKNLSSYNEDDLKDFDVERDVQGYAIHPTQQTRNIKLFNKIAEFFINIFYVFLLIWQLIVFLLCCCCQSDEDNADDKFDEESGESSESETEMNDLEDESVTVNSVIEERRRCEEDIKGYNVDLSNQCLIFVDKPKENDCKYG